MPSVRFIEELAANAWPALLVRHVDGWRLRFTPGIRAHRSASVLPIEHHGELSLDESLAEADAFYSEHDAPTMFQVSPAALPEGLEEELDRRGFAVEAPVSVQTAPLAAVVDHIADPSARAAVATGPPPTEWLEAWTAVFQRGDPEVARRAVFERIAAATAYASVERDGVVVGIGYGVLERGWLGIYGMGTVPDARRTGVGTAIVAALARWATASGGTHAYLQVEETNEPARRLYGRFAFEPTYGYHYRVRPV